MGAQQGNRVLVIKGDCARAGARSAQPSPIEVGPLGKKIKRGVQGLAGQLRHGQGGVVPLAPAGAADRRGLSGEPFPPGYCHFPRYGEEYFKQLTAEQLVTKLVKGYRRQEWQKMRERNEALDCRVYARAAAAQYGIDRFNERHWKAMEEQIGAAVQRGGGSAAVEALGRVAARPRRSRPGPRAGDSVALSRW